MAKTIVVGTSPTTGEVLVKDTGTGKMSWRPGTKEQIERVTSKIQKARYDEAPEYEEYEEPKAEEPQVRDSFLQETRPTRAQLEALGATERYKGPVAPEPKAEPEPIPLGGSIVGGISDIPGITEAREKARVREGVAAEPEPTLWQKITPWKEEEGETLLGKAKEHIEQAKEVLTRKVPEVAKKKWEEITPWEEQKGETLRSEVKEQLEKAKEFLKPITPTREGVKEYAEAVKEALLVPGHIRVRRDAALRELTTTAKEYDKAIAAYNRKVAKLQAEADRLAREAASVDVHDKGAVAAYNAKVGELRRKIAKLSPPEQSPAYRSYQQAKARAEQLQAEAAAYAKGTPLDILKRLFVREGIDPREVKQWVAEQEKVPVPKRLKAAGRELVSMVPIAGTVVDWSRMTPTERLISLGFDLAIVGSIAKAGFRPVTIRTWARQVAERAAEDTGLNQQLRKALKLGKGVRRVSEKHLTDLWKEVENAIKRGDKEEIARAGRLLQDVSKPLQLKGVEGWKQLQSKGRMLELKAGDIAEQSRFVKSHPESPEAGAVERQWGVVSDAEEKAYESALRRSRSKARRKQIEEALKELRRQKQVALKERERVAPVLQELKEFPEGRYLPSTRVATKQLTKSAKKIAVGTETKVALKALAEPLPYTQLARKLKVKPKELLVAVSRLPLTELMATLAVHPEMATELLKMPRAITSPEALTAIKSLVETKTVTKTKTEPVVTTKAVPVTEPAPYPEAEPVTKPAPAPTPAPTPYPYPEPAEVKPPPKRPVRFWISEEDIPEFVDFTKPSAATIAWRQGMFWKVLKPPYNKLETTKEKPEGAIVATGAGSAYKTAQRIGAGPIPRKVLVDMGVVDVIIERTGKRRAKMTVKPGKKTDISGEGKPLSGVAVVR